MCTSFCPKCGGDFLNDGPVCLGCLKKLNIYMPRTTEQRMATVNRLCNLAPDDDSEVFVPATADELAAMNERMATSGELTW